VNYPSTPLRVDQWVVHSELSTLFSVLGNFDKTSIKAYFNRLKNRLNMNFMPTPDGIQVINPDLHEYREFLWNIEFKYYITPIREDTFHKNNMKMLRDYIDRVVDDGFAPSRYYANKIAQATTEIERLTFQRDMIAEATDCYVTGVHETAQNADTAPSNESWVQHKGVFGAITPSGLLKGK
jgi:hypothetical protein